MYTYGAILNKDVYITDPGPGNQRSRAPWPGVSCHCDTDSEYCCPRQLQTCAPLMQTKILATPVHRLPELPLLPGAPIPWAVGLLRHSLTQSHSQTHPPKRPDKNPLGDFCFFSACAMKSIARFALLSAILWDTVFYSSSNVIVWAFGYVEPSQNCGKTLSLQLLIFQHPP